jgi:hypothetical protein
MTAPPPPPGWYPDPGAAYTQRYFDGTDWTDQLAPRYPSLPPPKRPAKSLQPFAIMAIAGLPTALAAFIAMQCAFSAAGGSADGSPWQLPLQIIGEVLFLVYLASLVAILAGVIGAIVRSIRQRRS